MPSYTYTKERAAARKADKPCAIRVDRRVKSLLDAMPEDEDVPIRLLGKEYIDFKVDPEADKQVSCAMSPPLSWWPEDAWNELRAHALGLYVGGMDLSQVAEIVWVNVDGVKELLKMRGREIKGGTGALHAHMSKVRTEAREFLEAREEILEVAV